MLVPGCGLRRIGRSEGYDSAENRGSRNCNAVDAVAEAGDRVPVSEKGPLKCLCAGIDLRYLISKAD